jgi:hypothetical protein
VKALTPNIKLTTNELSRSSIINIRNLLVTIKKTYTLELGFWSENLVNLV